MKFIIDSEGYYVGFGGSNTELQQGQSLVPFPPSSNLITPKWVNDNWIEDANAEQLYDVSLVNETQKYIQRTSDGVSAIAKFSAELRLAKLAGVITEDGHKAVDAALTPIRTEILAGQWISGKQLLEELGTSIIGQQLYDRIHNEISEYITVNY